VGTIRNDDAPHPARPGGGQRLGTHVAACAVWGGSLAAMSTRQASIRAMIWSHRSVLYRIVLYNLPVMDQAWPVRVFTA
jgi:hypothetical protein